jgi:preprotein translocase subunit YajC
MGILTARLVLLLADAPAPAAGGGEGSSGSNLLAMGFPLLMIVVFGYFLLFLPQKRERQKQEQFHKNLKKNDRVVTIGGVVGTIVNIEPEGKLITLKVDDNTRMTFVREAIQRKHGEGTETPALKETPK